MVKIKKKRRAKKLILRKRVCKFCTEKIEVMNYKDVARLSKFVTERGNIIPRRASGTCAKHQRELVCEIKRARFIALLPFIRK